MAWTFPRQRDGSYIAHDGARCRGLIVHKPKAARPWLAYRVTQTSKGLVLAGADSFRTLARAKAFYADNPGVWQRGAR